MKRLTWMVAALTLLLGGSGQAMAGFVSTGTGTQGGSLAYSPSGPDPMFNYTFNIAGNVGFGTLNAQNSGLGDGSLLVTGGTLTLTSSADPTDTPLGTYSLLAISGPPTVTSSPLGSSIVDDLIYPGNNAAGGANQGVQGFTTTGPSYLDYFGLLFGTTIGSTPEINLYYGNNGAQTYSMLTNTQNYDGGTFTLTSATPEPSSLILLGMGIASLTGYSRWRRRKQPVTA